MTEPEEASFNAVIHMADEFGDPDRTKDGELKLKTNWAKVAVDHLGRTFNKRIHDTVGGHPILDAEGLIKVRSRKAKPGNMKGENRSEAFVAANTTEAERLAYSHRLFNDDGGRLSQATGNDWEPVMTNEGTARMPVGQARGENTEAVLMRKPIEWFNEDQSAKRAANIESMERTKTPGEGQYDPEEDGKSNSLR